MRKVTNQVRQILVYRNSLSWGIAPDTRRRFEFADRWPGVLENVLDEGGERLRVVEDRLNGRPTAWEGPRKPVRNGLFGLEQRMEINSLLSLVIVFLGTNDFQSMHQLNAWQSAQGIAAIDASIRRGPVEPGMRGPEILVLAPPRIQAAKGGMAPKFSDAEKKAVGLAVAMKEVARDADCHFLDAGAGTETSKVDGVHLDQDQHLLLGQALASKVKQIID